MEGSEVTFSISDTVEDIVKGDLVKVPFKYEVVAFRGAIVVVGLRALVILMLYFPLTALGLKNKIKQNTCWMDNVKIIKHLKKYMFEELIN